MKAVIMANDLFASLRTYLNKVSDGERTPAELANALNTWVKQSGDVLKSKIDEEVHNTVTRMGFIKRDEFDELNEIDATDVSEHAARYEALHQKLQETLSGIDGL